MGPPNRGPSKKANFIWNSPTVEAFGTEEFASVFENEFDLLQISMDEVPATGSADLDLIEVQDFDDDKTSITIYSILYYRDIQATSCKDATIKNPRHISLKVTVDKATCMGVNLQSTG